MVDKAKFCFMKQKYGLWLVGAVWSEAEGALKSNVGDLSVFEGEEFLKVLNRKLFLLG